MQDRYSRSNLTACATVTVRGWWGGGDQQGWAKKGDVLGGDNDEAASHRIQFGIGEFSVIELTSLVYGAHDLLHPSQRHHPPLNQCFAGGVAEDVSTLTGVISILVKFRDPPTTWSSSSSVNSRLVALVLIVLV
jgi:hypothetical protein